MTAPVPPHCITEIGATPAGLEEIQEKARARIEEERKAFSEDAQNQGKSSPEADPMTNFLLDCAESGQIGDARVLIYLFRDRFRHDHASGRWYQWQGHYWVEDVIFNIVAEVDKVIEIYEKEAKKWAWIKIKEKKSRNEEVAAEAQRNEDVYLKKISKLQNKTYRLNVIYLSAVGTNSLGISGDEWDQHPYLIACPNGIFDLRDDQFRDGRQEDYVKTICPTEWLGHDAPAPRWELFLMEIFNGSREIISYLHKALGYGIAGLTIEHILIILWGIGRNGKGVLIETLFHVLGPLAGPIQSEMLLEQKNPRSSAAPSPDLISLRGKRLVSASETDEGRRLNAAKVKYLVGGDTILAREPYGRREVSFRPSHTLLLLTNHRPKVSADDFALWNRLHLVPFTLSFVDHPTESHHRQRDPQLLESLKEEASGILAWLVRGFKEYKIGGLQPPPQIIDATKAYRKNEDDLGKFIEACCVGSSEARTKGGDLYKAYQKWSDSNGFKPMWGNKFGMKIAERFSKGKNGVYRGIGIKLEAEWGA